MARAYYSKVTTIHRRDLLDLQALSRGDDRRVDGSEREIAIRRDELGDPQPIGGRNGLYREGAAREVAEEADLRLDAKPGCQ